MLHHISRRSTRKRVSISSFGRNTAGSARHISSALTRRSSEIATAPQRSGPIGAGAHAVFVGERGIPSLPRTCFPAATHYQDGRRLLSGSGRIARFRPCQGVRWPEEISVGIANVNLELV